MTDTKDTKLSDAIVQHQLDMIDILTDISGMSDSQLSHAYETLDATYQDMCAEYVANCEPYMPTEPLRLIYLQRAVIQRLR